jgi:hypothetical protein
MGTAYLQRRNGGRSSRPESSLFLAPPGLQHLRLKQHSAPPDNNWNGFDFWKGNTQGNVDQCYKDIVNAFLQSGEYRARFGCS